MTARWRHLLNSSAQVNDDATFTFRLPERGFLHALRIRVGATGGATGARNTSPLTIADRLRVVGNGDFRYHDLSPVEIEKWWETKWGKGLDMLTNEASGGLSHVILPVLFGRKMYDPEYNLPLARVQEPRIEIPYSPTIAADGGFATGSTTFNIMALWSPESDRLPYRGTMVTQTIKNFTSLASGDDETAIDIQDPIRYIGVYAYENQVNDGVDITRVRLEANVGEYDLWQGDWDDFIQFNREKFGAEIAHYYRLFVQDTDVLDTRLGDPLWWNLSPLAGSNIANDTFTDWRVNTITGDRLTFIAAEGDITAGAETYVTLAADARVHAQVVGASPAYFGFIPFTEPDEPGGWLNPGNFDKLKLILTQGGAGATVNVGLQYVKNIPVGAGSGG